MDKRGDLEPVMRLFINGLAASAGGGLTYLRNVVPHLSGVEGLHTTLALREELGAEFVHLPGISVAATDCPSGAAKRFWYEQTALPKLVAQSRADVLISAGNVALRNSPVPQILLSRNSLYTSADFFHDLRSRRDYKMWLDTRLKAALAKRSLSWADLTVAPSEAFAAELRRWTGRAVTTIHHGFDSRLFFNRASLPLEIQKKLDASTGSVRLLFVSHYNYYRNFETLLRAVTGLRGLIPDIKLLLTSKLDSEENPSGYRSDSAAALVNKLRLEDSVVQLGSIPYHTLHHVYAAVDIYVTPAYTESFAHPLVEAMASGVPVIASDIEVHREICGEAAVYFTRFSVPDLTANIAQLATNPELRSRMSAAGQRRAADFSWKKHVRQMLETAARLKAVPGSPTVIDDAGKISLPQIA
jgi:glycosyltransferase involved in cell wall biosynthesis